MLKKEVLYRADMLLKNEDSLCLSSRVHDALKAADNSANLSGVLHNLINQGELITLKQLVYYVNELGLQLDIASDFTECIVSENAYKYYDIHSCELIFEYNFTLNKNAAPHASLSYLVDRVGWCEGAILVHIIVLSADLLEAQLADTEIEADPFEDAVFECDIFYGDVEF